MRAFIVAAAVAALAAAPASAQAAKKTQYYIPPGNSSANEYVEGIPTAGGGSATLGITPGGGRRPPSGGAGALSHSTRSTLVRQGRDGALTAAFVAASSPARAQRGSTGQHPAVRASGSAAPSSTPSVASLLRSVTGAGGQGASSQWLLVILIAVALGTGSIALRRRLAKD